MQSLIIPIIIFLIALIGGSIGGIVFVKSKRTATDLARSKEMKYFRIVIPRKISHKDREEAVEKDFKEALGAFEQLLTGLHATYKNDIHHYINDQDFFGFEIAAKDFTYTGEGEKIEFFAICLPKYQELIEKQITSFYQDATIEEAPEHTIFLENSISKGSLVRPKKDFFFPIQTYKNLDTDPLNNLTNAVSNLPKDSGAAIQLLIQPVSHSWSLKNHKKSKSIQEGTTVSTNGFMNFLYGIFALFKKKNETQPTITNTQQEQMKAIDEKSRKPGFKTLIRVVATSTNEMQATSQLQTILSGFGQFEDQILNGFSLNFKEKFSKNSVNGYVNCFLNPTYKPYILNTEELTSIFHFPNAIYNKTPSIDWQNFKLAPAPPDLPSEGLLLGYNAYRGEKRDVMISEKDRFRHLYIIGQTGMGKSVLQKTLAKQDIKNGYGICVVDPHGDLIDDILEWVPPERADAMNMMIGLFGGEIFGPRLQDYFRNGCLTLMDDEEEGGALTDIVRLFTDEAWQQYKVSKVRNPIVKSFWTKQMASTGQREKEEMIPFLASKFGAFVTNTTMRNIVGQTKSSFDFTEAMDSNKIILVKLAKGLIGDINANLLGMIIVNKIQVAAMRRASIPGDQRVPFFLYVDEFQNFVTDAFESILSEARKYKLGLIIAHQYIGQLIKEQGNEKVKNAVFGNVGTMLSFKIGATDAEYMEKEMSPVFASDDLINLRGFNTIIKLNMNNIISTPFSMNTVKDFDEGNKKSADAITALSRLKYGRDKRIINKEILERLGGDSSIINN